MAATDADKKVSTSARYRCEHCREHVDALSQTALWDNHYDGGGRTAWGFELACPHCNKRYWIWKWYPEDRDDEDEEDEDGDEEEEEWVYGSFSGPDNRYDTDYWY